ncbi:MAG: hypothetical protein H6745_32090 [Deltaproteobacteria bacterium]|nr:hypothetical protein [Deltaproteobacteria bacterium]
MSESALTTQGILDAFREGRVHGQRGPVGVAGALLTPKSLVLFLPHGTVLKLRRPRQVLGVDQTTRSLRVYGAEQELWIGRRASPSVYLADCSLQYDGERYEIVPGVLGGEPLVAMRRLPDEGRLDALVVDPATTAETLRPIAALLADFHEGSPLHRAHDDGYGRPERNAERWERALTSLATAPDAPLTADEHARLAGETGEWLAACEGHFVHRITEGRIRHAHGDVRLEHLYLEDGGAAALIDPSEARDELHWMDTAEELGALGMELDAAGRRDLAEEVLDLYAGLTQDRTLRYVTPIFKRLAAIRRAIQLVAEREEGEVDAAAKARFYVDLALSYGG